MKKDFDALVIGGGFYGSYLALSLRKMFSRVAIVEKEEDLLKRASYVNQARIHNGYHYPRSLLTASRSFLNFPKFLQEFPECVDKNFEKVYAVAKNQSKVNANQFFEFCKRIGAPVKQSPKNIKIYFNKYTVEEVFSVEEVAFDADKLREHLKRSLQDARVDVFLKTKVEKITEIKSGLETYLSEGDILGSKLVFNTAYSQINNLLLSSGLETLPLKHELTELALVEPPEEIAGLGITLIDGPFFSTMPFPSRNLHSFSHVRYTPHETLNIGSLKTHDTHEYLKQASLSSNFIYMQKDAERFVPILSKTKYKESLYEVKTVLMQNEIDDGRPILFRRHHGLKNFFVVMGGKIDNIYDINQAVISSLTKEPSLA